jgi:methylated-DNA-[protein]-cysteine S-methyltransferase
MGVMSEARTCATVSRTIESPVGPLGVAASDRGLTMVAFDGERGIECESELLDRAESQLREYFAGTRTDFDLPLAPPVEGLLGRVLRALAEVPYGETVSYKELTLAAGIEIERVRDVGSALGRNPLAIVLPCHRVIGADGNLVGFGGGLERKRTLLDLEAPQLTLA